MTEAMPIHLMFFGVDISTPLEIEAILTSLRASGHKPVASASFMTRANGIHPDGGNC